MGHGEHYDPPMTEKLTILLAVAACACSGTHKGSTDSGTDAPDATDGVECDIDCGPHGTCVIVDGVPGCECDPGWGGERCATFLGSRLEIHALDIWATELEGASLSIDYNGEALETDTPVTEVEPGEAGTFSIHLEAPGFHPLDLTIVYSGENSASAFAVPSFPNEAGHGLSVSRDLVDGNWTHAFYLGLRHRWFSAVGPPARPGNRIELMMDGERAWGAVADGLAAATSFVHMATWWWESDFELRRAATPDDIYATTTERWPNTIMGVLDALPAVQRRILVNQFMTQDGILEDYNVDDHLLDRGATPGDGFEFMGQVNPTEGVFEFEMETFLFGDRVRQRRPGASSRTFDGEAAVVSPVPGHAVDITLPLGIEGVSVASYHQKFIVIDGTHGFVGGMNVEDTDWDTSDHLVFDPRRMAFDATTAERGDVLAKEASTDTPPRKDYMLAIDGPIIEDVAEVFKARWDYVLAEGVRFSENSSTFDVTGDLPPHDDGVTAQLTVTLPDPFWRHSILETWYSAISNAERYIYIEDQYFRAPMLNELIAARMSEVPGLVLIVVTLPVDEWTDPGCWWTHLTDTFFETSFPGRYRLYQLRSFDTVDVGWGFDETESRFEDIYVHSKILIVDDMFLSLGSCNHNNRGLVYEGEMDVAILDPAFVREARSRIFASILDAYYTDPDDTATMADEFELAAAWNDAVWTRWEAEGWDISLDGAPLPAEYDPYGFLYSLDFRAPEDCLLEDISGDLTFN